MLIRTFKLIPIYIVGKCHSALERFVVSYQHTRFLSKVLGCNIPTLQRQTSVHSRNTFLSKLSIGSRALVAVAVNERTLCP